MHCTNALSKIAIPSLSTICTISEILVFRNAKVCSVDADCDCHIELLIKIQQKNNKKCTTIALVMVVHFNMPRYLFN